MTFSKTFLAIGLLTLLSACSSDKGNNGGTNTVVVCPGVPGSPCNGGTGGTAVVPVCDANALAPFVPTGTSSRVSQLPQGSFRYNGGDVYAETTNQNPQTQVAIADDQPMNPAYPGNLKCVTNVSGSIPMFSTSGSTIRNIQVAGTNYNLNGLRTLAASFSNGTLQTLFFDASKFEVKTTAQIEAEQVSREAQGWSVNVYQLSATEYKIILIRPISNGGVTATLFIAARYTYTP